jgi:hypothetical protein
MNFIHHNMAEAKEKLTTFKEVSMRFNDIEIDSLTQYDTTRFLYAGKPISIYPVIPFEHLTVCTF